MNEIGALQLEIKRVRAMSAEDATKYNIHTIYVKFE